MKSIAIRVLVSVLMLLGVSSCDSKNIKSSLDRTYISFAHTFWVYLGENDTFPHDYRGAGFALYKLREQMSQDEFCRNCDPVITWDHSNKVATEMQFEYLNDSISSTQEPVIVLVSQVKERTVYLIDSALVTYKIHLEDERPRMEQVCLGLPVTDCLKGLRVVWSHPIAQGVSS